MAAEVVRPLGSLLLPPSVWLGCSQGGWVSHLTQLLLGLVKGIDYPVKLGNVGVDGMNSEISSLIHILLDVAAESVTYNSSYNNSP